MTTHTADSIRALINADQTGKAACRAICALFREQTADEKAVASTRHDNARGFSQAHAKVGTEMARWMCAGDDGVMTRRVGGKFPLWLREGGKWVKNPSAFAGRDRIEVATEIALHYAGQLAVIANANAAKRAA
jgi:hypothetical protein